MPDIGGPLLAFVVGTSIVAIELLTGNYPRTASFVVKSRPFWIYAGIYGLIAALLLAVFDAAGLKLEGLGVGSDWWVRAIGVGASIKGFMHINFFNVPSGTQSFPVGVATIVQLFEPALLRTILLEEYAAVRAYIAPRGPKNPNPPTVKAAITQNIPGNLSSTERAAFLNDLDKAIPATPSPSFVPQQGIVQAMELYLRFVGRKMFEQVFP